MSSTATRTHYFDTRTWSYGAEAQAGFEWFVRNRLSLAARYGVWAMWTRGERHSEDGFSITNDFELRTDDATVHGFNIGTTPATFSVIAYW